MDCQSIARARHALQLYTLRAATPETGIAAHRAGILQPSHHLPALGTFRVTLYNVKDRPLIGHL
jgi:hypothetical protein